MKKYNELIKGFIDSIPLGISVSIYGLVYGVLGGKAGMSLFEITAMSAFVFAGASQIAFIQMFSQGANPISIILTVFIINLRHYLMAASVAPYIKDSTTKFKMLNAFFMTDESYGVTYSHFQNNKPSNLYFLGSGLNIYLFWGIAGVLGYMFGNIIPKQLNYIFDFAFAAAFISMLIPMIKDFPTVATVAASAVISILGSLYIPGKWYILIAGIGASFIGYIVSTYNEGKRGTETKCIEVTGNE
jgi:predicted branched-subunit amino acid permease